MAKNTDADAPARARRRRADNRGAKNAFQWDSVDDQAQEDLIEPVAVPKRKRSRARRDEHVANTLYASNPYEDRASVKKRPVKTKQAEDYAEFVAEVGDDEIDPYAIPSYGSTRLTRGDEELVEELAERARRDRRPARKPDPDEEAPSDEKPVKTPRAAKKRSDDAKRGSNERSESVAEESKSAPKEEAPAPKTSFLSKIKKAVASTTGAGSETSLPPKRLEELSRSAQKVLDATGVKSNVKLNRKGQSQLEVLANVVEALLDANLALLAKVLDAAASSGEPEKREERGAEDARSSASSEPSDGESARVASRGRSRRDNREAEPKRSEREKPANSSAPTLARDVDAGDSYDPFAFWESIEDDEKPEVAEPKPTKKRVRPSDAAACDSDGDSDDRRERDSKKKSSLVEKAAPRRNERRLASAPENELDARGDSETKALPRFGELKLKKATLKALRAMGYSEPTPIQAGSIPTIQKGIDVMGQARTGTGKTAAFMIPIVEDVSERERRGAPLALVVLPTRELAVQVRDEAQKIARFYDLSVAACYGGKPLASQVEKLRQGVDILVGTPGRIIDLSNRGALSLASARWVVLDEADRMLDIGFRPDVERILRLTPSTRQTLLFSATLPPDVVRLAETYMRDPERFDFSQKDVAAETIEQYYMTVDQDRKFDALTRLLEVQNPRQTIVFCRTKRHVDAVARRLSSKFPNVEAIHGDLPQTKRDRIMQSFRSERTKILVATDVVGRGIDVSTVSHIINYDIPQYCDDYVHRVGRAGRMGREGVAFTLVTAEEGAELTRIEIRINRLLERYEIPGFEAVSRPVESSERKEPERKHVFGRSERRIRRAL